MQTTTDLSLPGGGWITIEYGIPNAGRSTSYTHEGGATGEPKQFYRIKED